MQTTPEVDGNITQATFIGFINEYSDVDQVVSEALGMRKNLRKRIKGAGLNLVAFDRARAEAARSTEEREEEDREFRRNLAWLGKPLGYQLDWIGGAEAATPNGEDEAEIAQHQVHQVELAGKQAGEDGRNRSANPWTAGSFLHERWDESWLAGQDVLAQRIKPAEPRRARAPRLRGRPPGVRNRPKDLLG
jgi:hypothetical protein